MKGNFGEGKRGKMCICGKYMTVYIICKYENPSIFCVKTTWVFWCSYRCERTTLVSSHSLEESIQTLEIPTSPKFWDICTFKTSILHLSFIRLSRIGTGWSEDALKVRKRCWAQILVGKHQTRQQSWTISGAPILPAMPESPTAAEGTKPNEAFFGFAISYWIVAMCLAQKRSSTRG